MAMKDFRSSVIIIDPAQPQLLSVLFLYVLFKRRGEALPFLFFLRFYLFIFRERGREGERQGEKHQCEKETTICGLSYISHVRLNLDRACNPGMCPDWELNWQPFALQDVIQPIEPHQSEPLPFLYYPFETYYIGKLLHADLLMGANGSQSTKTPCQR